MKKSFLAAALFVSAGVVTAQAAFFYSATTSVNSRTGDLTVNWDERGLGNGGGPITYTLTGSASAVYACMTKSGNHPQATNKEGPSSFNVTSQPFDPKGGRVVGSLTVLAPANTSLSCPSGQNLVLACVSYTNLVLTDTVNNSQVTLGTTSTPVTPVKGVSCG
ncbi:hypothetical protein ACI48D_16935 [Massilia sp. LXY-6]|uniref:hypothetical protein n=1 Tax=Massilia sp. LXY-6 TaxID=3379823 RepID=UPI003EE003C0